MARVIVSAEQRFWAKVKKGKGPNACWLWTACTTKGYGRFDKSTAHRFSWELHRGPIPEGLCVCHNCPGGDNPLCANPKHLWLGDDTQNHSDMISKGRQSCGKGISHGTRTHPESIRRGVDRAFTKLTDAQVSRVRYLYEQKQIGTWNTPSLTSVAESFGVSLSVISNVVHYKVWTHVQ